MVKGETNTPVYLKGAFVLPRVIVKGDIEPDVEDHVWTFLTRTGPHRRVAIKRLVCRRIQVCHGFWHGRNGPEIERIPLAYLQSWKGEMSRVSPALRLRAYRGEAD